MQVIRGLYKSGQRSAAHRFLQGKRYRLRNQRGRIHLLHGLLRFPVRYTRMFHGPRDDGDADRGMEFS